MNHFLFLIIPVLISSYSWVFAQSRGSQCNCVEYWECVVQGGVFYSYCNYSYKVCCFVHSYRSVGLLPSRIKLDSCGRKGADDSQEGVAESGEWPWHVAILQKELDLYICGGTLVDEYWILTAAHCIDGYSSLTRALKVRFGEHDVNSEQELHPHEEADVESVRAHPLFNNETLEADIALLRLRRPARPRPHVNTICLPIDEAEEAELTRGNTSCFITGWGRTSEVSGHSSKLKEVPVPVWLQADCQSALQLHFGKDFNLPSSSLCAGAEGRDACDGDGGGPLVCSRRSRWYQVGVISFGIGCGRKNIPGVYTRVQTFSKWILDTVASYVQP